MFVNSVLFDKSTFCNGHPPNILIPPNINNCVICVPINIKFCIPQFRNAITPIVVNEDGNITLFNEVHPENALAPIVVNEDGNITLFNEVHPENALASIVVNVDGNITEVIKL